MKKYTKLIFLSSLFIFTTPLFSQSREDEVNTENVPSISEIIENEKELLEETITEEKEEDASSLLGIEEYINIEETKKDSSDKEEEVIHIVVPKKEKKDVFATGFLSKVELTTQIETCLYFSPESARSHSNILNFIYPISIGLLWPRDFFIGFGPTISFVPMSFLWYEDMAIPSEIENRTATTLLTFLNLPAVFTIKLPHSKMHITAGLGLCLRYGFLSIGVNKNDNGYNGNTAKEDLKLINNWFWENGHWLYVTVGTSWLYPITDRIKVGPAFDLKLPMGTLIDQKNFQGTMLNVGFKLCL